MNKVWLIVCSWIALVNTVCSSLKVTGNSALNDALKDFPNGAIPYALAHFGVVPYGVTILGLAHFDPENTHGCKEGKLIPYNSDDITPILVVRRSECDFIAKAKNAQAMGASLLLIVDDKGEDVTHLNAVAFRDGSKAKIASLIIDQKAGEAIINALSSRDTTIAQSVIVQFAMELNKANKVDLDIILGVVDKSAFQFLSAFKDMAQDLDAKHFNINYTFHMTSCKGWEQTLISKNCLNDNPEFCVIAGGDGKPLIQTTLLMKCALEDEDFKNNFMAFSERYMEDCLEEVTDASYPRLFECAQATIKAFSPKFKGATGDCYKKNFQSGKILHGDAQAVQTISEHPVVYVNNKTIDGSLSADNIFQAVCFAYNKPPKTCAFTKGMYVHSKALTEAVREVHTTESRFITFNVVIVILVVVVASVFFYYLFKRTYKQMIRTQVDGMIKDSIDKYRRMGLGNETEL